MPKPILCPCGTEKFYLNGVTACPHCDFGCRTVAAGKRCYLCAAYSISVNNRVNGEHANEKRRNGC